MPQNVEIRAKEASAATFRHPWRGVKGAGAAWRLLRAFLVRRWDEAKWLVVLAVWLAALAAVLAL